MTNIKISVVL